jgi:hypothetical protein
MNKEIKDFLEALDDWTLYVQEGDDMPYICLKPDSPAYNILVQADSFDSGDEDSFKDEGLVVFSSSQMNRVVDLFSRLGVAKVEYVPLGWFNVLVKSLHNVEEE